MYFIQNPHQSRAREIITHQIQVRTEQKWYMRFSIPRRKYCRLFLCWCTWYATVHHFFFCQWLFFVRTNDETFYSSSKKKKYITFKMPQLNLLEIYWSQLCNLRRNSITGSAVCAFRFRDMEDSYQGAFKEQASAHHNWLPVPEKNVPRPSPAAVSNTKSTRLLPCPCSEAL